jgi:pyridoxamine 5'-phosphate oxidase
VQNNKPDYYNDLDKIYSKIWNLLKNGLKDRNASCHLPTFISGKDSSFDGRLVVLRGVDENEKKIWFHSDIRSSKIKVLKNNPRSVLLFYDKIEKIQLRASTKVIINYKNEITKLAWGKTAHMSRQCYLGEKAPGLDALIPTSGLSKKIDDYKYTIDESESGYQNFCVIQNFVQSFEWLYLAAKGHRRAFFNLNKKPLEMKWLIP